MFIRREIRRNNHGKNGVKSGGPDWKIREVQKIPEGILPQSALRFSTEKPTLRTALIIELGKVENGFLGNSKE